MDMSVHLSAPKGMWARTAIPGVVIGVVGGCIAWIEAGAVEGIVALLAFTGAGAARALWWRRRVRGYRILTDRGVLQVSDGRHSVSREIPHDAHVVVVRHDRFFEWRRSAFGSFVFAHIPTASKMEIQAYPELFTASTEIILSCRSLGVPVITGVLDAPCRCCGMVIARRDLPSLDAESPGELDGDGK